MAKSKGQKKMSVQTWEWELAKAKQQELKAMGVHDVRLSDCLAIVKVSKNPFFNLGVEHAEKQFYNDLAKQNAPKGARKSGGYLY